MIYIMTFNADAGREEFTPGEENQITPGKTIADWLATKLAVLGVVVEDSYEEDWGWEMRLDVLHDGQQQGYYLGVSGTEIGPKIEWKLTITKQRSMLERLSGHNVLQHGDTLIETLQRLLRENDHQVTDSHWQPE